jgi:hypothetical protein
MSVISPIQFTGPYLMDPETEDLIFGDDLCENMIVLVESQLCRHEEIAPDIFAQRWCQVTRLRRTAEHATFIGVYADGSKATRRYHLSHNWFVKKASMR